jgi:hypothetical protein
MIYYIVYECKSYVHLCKSNNSIGFIFNGTSCNTFLMLTRGDGIMDMEVGIMVGAITTLAMEEDMVTTDFGGINRDAAVKVQETFTK